MYILAKYTIDKRVSSHVEVSVCQEGQMKIGLQQDRGYRRGLNNGVHSNYLVNKCHF